MLRRLCGRPQGRFALPRMGGWRKRRTKKLPGGTGELDADHDRARTIALESRAWIRYRRSRSRWRRPKRRPARPRTPCTAR
ncbi:hypothetical protein [Lysobacter gummosus]|uniref:hypothetical protein n=1 Tax=Lysobacter gummosus TaxID=262324 RepID=UPI00363C93C0